MRAVLTATDSAAHSISALINGAFLVGVLAVVMLAVFLPFAAALVLDALVVLLRDRRIVPLLITITFASLVGIAGVVAYRIGLPQTGAPANAAANFRNAVTLLLPWSCGLALLGVLVRQGKAAVKARLR